MATKRRLFFIPFLAAFFFFLVFVKSNVYADSGKTYVYLVGGRGQSSQYDVNKMRKVLTNNRISEFPGLKTFQEYVFNADNKDEAGTKKAFESGFSTAFKQSTNNDLAFFVYSGHGMEDQDGNGLGLAFGNNNYYKYKDLANKLSKVKCKRMVIIINACAAGAFYNLGYQSLSKSFQNKSVVFLSSASNQSSYRDTLTSRGAHFIEYIADGLGQRKVIYADKNADHRVTVKELAEYVNLRTKEQGIRGIPDMDPEFYSNQKSTVLFTYTGIQARIIDQTVFVGEKVKIAPSVSGTRNKEGTWTSSNPSIVKVNSTGAYGTFLGKKAGTATITYKIGSATAKCKVTVVGGLKLNKAKATLYTKGYKSDKTITLVASIEGKDFRSDELTWASSNTSVATVKNGKVTARKEGTAAISVKLYGMTKTCKVTVKSINIKLTAEILDDNVKISTLNLAKKGWSTFLSLSDYKGFVLHPSAGTIARVGDTLNITYTSAGGSYTGTAYLELGSGTFFIDGFDTRLVGHKAGDVVDIVGTFNNRYGDQNLVGQQTNFKVTINYIQYLSPMQVFTYVVNTSKTKSYPADLYKSTLKILRDYFSEIATDNNMTYAEVLAAYGYNEESLAREDTKAWLVAQAILKSEGFSCGDYQSDIDAALRIIEQYAK